MEKIKNQHESGDVVEINPELEEEARQDVGTTQRKKIEIKSDDDPRVIQRRYGVSKSAAYRAIKQGWLFLNYHERLVEIDSGWAEENVEKLKRAAKSGARIAIVKLGKGMDELRPFDFEDVVSASYVRLMELSGHPERENQNWLITVARNAALDFIKSQIIRPSTIFSEDTEDVRDRREDRGE